MSGPKNPFVVRAFKCTPVPRRRSLVRPYRANCPSALKISANIHKPGPNSPLGFWLNLALTSVTDVGFILFIIVPGYLPLGPGLLGPGLWVLALIFSALGQFAR